ncbi:efflux RND transporter periplasmic adaptor subunit [Thiocapsa bogorovii]|uniref:efflux RND transporter periplasmic adaptor subunit n=1 Tax=Thiocapsa bogorovii TaxID=521689 RepID=UPI001E4F779B|nr:efflux RND transporter periplasmic adaptor subunit [Thiocapsa bogorovii]UHD15204.1 efflux RND transporter periplasmic adaptor subunit [Thiocapsa bogorovii]
MSCTVRASQLGLEPRSNLGSDPSTGLFEIRDISVRLGRLLCFVLFGGLTLSGCGQPDPPAPEMPPPSVVVVPAESRVVDEEASFVGRVIAVNRVDLRARVEGFLEERRFAEGQEIQVGDVLFVIEPGQYAAAVEQRQADLEKARADQLNTAAQLARGLELVKAKNISQSSVDELQAADSIAKAGITLAQAALTQAMLDLSYTTITAPVAGRIGLASYTVGNLVGPSSGTLATIVSRDPIYVQFPVTQRDLLGARQTIEKKGGNAREVKVRVRLPDGTLYEHSGRLDFVDVTTDPGTDSVTLRAELPNPDGILVDRQYVGVLLEAGAPESAILIPQSALQVDQQGIYVMILDADGKAQMRRIETGQTKGPDVIVTEGLNEDELVITQGIQQVRPGQAVSAAPATSAAGALEQ